MIHRPSLLWFPKRRSWPTEVERGLSSISCNVVAVLRDANTGRIKDIRMVHNIVTDTYLDLLMTGAGNLANAVTALSASADGTPPLPSDNGIGVELSARTTTDGGLGGGGYMNTLPDYAYRRVSRRFSAAQGNGTIRKLGLFTVAVGGSMYAAALMVDANGALAPLTKTAADTLDVVWEFRLFTHYPTAINAVVAGVARSLVVSPVNMNANRDSMLNTGWNFTQASTWRRNLAGEVALGLFERTASTGGGDVIAQNAAAYVNGTFTRDITLPSLAIADIRKFWGLVNVGATFYSEQLRFDNILPNPTPIIVLRFALARSTKSGQPAAEHMAVSTGLVSGQHFQEYQQSIAVSTAFQSGTLT